MKLMTILYAEHNRDIPVAVPVPACDSDEEAALRKRRMQDKLEWAKAALGDRYVFHPTKMIRREQATPFVLERSK